MITDFSQLKKKANFLLVQNSFFSLSLTVEKENNRFSSQIFFSSSQNNVPKYHPGLHEKKYYELQRWHYEFHLIISGQNLKIVATVNHEGHEGSLGRS